MDGARSRSERRKGRRRLRLGSVPRFDPVNSLLARRADLAIAVVLLLLVALAYANSVPGELVLDSRSIIGEDTRIRAFTDENIHLIFTKNYWWPTYEVELYRPLTTLSYLFNYTILRNGPSPYGYHVLNLLLHWLDTVLVFALVRRVLSNSAAAAFVAAVFAIHPLSTEVVTNIVGRADLLASLFLLLGLYLHIRSRQEPARSIGLIRVALGTSAVLAILCKESGAVLVGLMLLYDLIYWDWPKQGSVVGAWRDWWGRGGWKNYAAMLPSLALLLGIRVLLNLDSPMFGQIGADNPIAITDFWTGRMTAVKVLGYYLSLFFWPARLSCDYSYDQIPLFGWTFCGDDLDAWIALAMLLALAALAPVTWRRQKAVCFFLGFAFITLLPASNLLLTVGSIMGERFMYLSVAGLTAAILALYLPARSKIVAALDRLAPPMIVAKVSRWLELTIAGVLILALGWRTAVRNLDWHDETQLFAAAVRDCPNSFKGYKGLANAITHNDPDGEHLDQAISIAEQGLAIIDAKPLPLVHMPAGLLLDLGRYYGRTGQNLAQSAGANVAAPPEAIACFKKAQAILKRAVETDRAVNEASHEKRLSLGQRPEEIYDVGLPAIYQVLALVEWRLKDYDAAADACNYAIRLAPHEPAPYRSLSLINESRGEADESAVNCLQAMVLNDTEPETLTRLARAYARLQPGEMVVTPEANGTLTLNQSNPMARRHLDRACQALVSNALDAKRPDTAWQIAEMAVKRYQCPPQLFAVLLGPQTRSRAAGN